MKSKEYSPEQQGEYSFAFIEKQSTKIFSKNIKIYKTFLHLDVTNTHKGNCTAGQRGRRSRKLSN